MTAKRSKTPIPPTAEPPRASAVALSDIEELAREIGEKFRPERVILFGSYAYGQPNEDSDVDLLVVMPAANMINQAVRISLAVHPRFPKDLIVRTPDYLKRRLEGEDWFLREIVGQGKVLYEAGDAGVGGQGRGGPEGGDDPRRGCAEGS